MKMRSIVAVVIFALLAPACASVGVKAKATNTLLSAHTTLASVDDAERALCVPAPTDPTHCTAPAASAIGLTDARHKRLSAQLGDAFALDRKAAEALKAWVPGQPVPQSIPELVAAARQIVAIASELAPDSAARLMNTARDLVIAAEALLAKFAK